MVLINMKKSIVLLFILSLSFTIFANSLPTGYLIESNTSYNASINWTKQDIEVVGYGALIVSPDKPYFQAKLMAREAAKTDAYRNLAEMLKGVYVTSETTVLNFITENDLVRKKVEMFIQGAEIIEEKEIEGGGYAVKVRLALSGPKEGNIASVLLPEVVKNDSEVLTTTIQFGSNYEEKATYQVPKSTSAVTGVIIDARNLEVRPAMSPKIFSSDGKEVFGPRYIDPYINPDSTIVAYTRDLETARSLARVGENPVVINAIGISGTNQSDVVIAKADADFIGNINKLSGFLADGRVVIIIK